MWLVGNTFRGVLRSLIFLFWDPFFWAYGFSWFLIRFSRQNEIIIPILNNWLTDFIFVPLIAHCAQTCAIFLLNRFEAYKFPLRLLIFKAALTSLAFEVILPGITTYQTSDKWDVLAYFSGAFFYYLIHQPYSLKKYKGN